MWAAQLSERCNGILLADFEGNDGAARKILNNGQILWQDTLVDIVKFFDDGA